NQLAHAMLRLGLRPRDRVGTLCGNSLEFTVTIYGLAKAGLVWVPVNPGLAPEDVNYILRHAEVKALFIDDAYYGLYQRTGFVPEIPPVIIKATGGPGPENLEVWEKLVASAPEGEVEVEIWDRDLCQIMYTSGTTAAPKGVMTSHLAVFVASLNNIIELNITRDSVISCLMPLFHCAQHTFLTSALHAGGTAVIMRGFEVGELVRAIHEERITWLFALPGMYRALLDYPERSRFDLSSLRTCLYAMTPMDRRTLTEAIEQLGAEFCLGTCQTECYPSTNNFKPEWQLKKEGNYWGESALTLETAVMDDEGHLLPPGQVGEIVWRGPTVMEGYLKDEAATAESRKFGWHHSGDLGYFDEDGLLVFVDRKKDMIKTGGE
ncbi:MAG: AMP-binding protein, partial [Firmicutes bacterium]|nr:AMP-binding protein [Bacillota bacterium]